MRNYWDYIKTEQLLSLQGGFDNDESALANDEVVFIVVHQVYELWFKLILRSLRLGRDRMSEPRVAEETVPFVVHHLRRVSTVLELAVQHWKLVETLTPQDFLAFREDVVPWTRVGEQAFVNARRLPFEFKLR